MNCTTIAFTPIDVNYIRFECTSDSTGSNSSDVKHMRDQIVLLGFHVSNKTKTFVIVTELTQNSFK